MKKMLLAIAGILTWAIVSPGSAAELAIPTKAPPLSSAPVFSWTGFYIGGNFGGGWGRTDASTSNTLGGAPAGTFESEFDSRGIFGGGQIGYNYQLPNKWVVGIEADAQGGELQAPYSGCPKSAGVVLGCQSTSSVGDAFGTIRGRLGYAWNNLLLYGTGGWAWGHVSSTAILTCAGPGCPAINAIPALAGSTSSATGRLAGTSWAAGGGVEWGFLPRWTFRAEYLRLEIDDLEENFNFVSGPTVLAAHVQTNNGINVVRVGLNYFFN